MNGWLLDGVAAFLDGTDFLDDVVEPDRDFRGDGWLLSRTSAFLGGRWLFDGAAFLSGGWGGGGLLAADGWGGGGGLLPGDADVEVEERLIYEGRRGSPELYLVRTLCRASPTR